MRVKATPDAMRLVTTAKCFFVIAYSANSSATPSAYRLRSATFVQTIRRGGNVRGTGFVNGTRKPIRAPVGVRMANTRALVFPLRRTPPHAPTRRTELAAPLPGACANKAEIRVLAFAMAASRAAIAGVAADQNNRGHVLPLPSPHADQHSCVSPHIS